jgi:hypothetical protein
VPGNEGAAWAILLPNLNRTGWDSLTVETTSQAADDYQAGALRCVRVHAPPARHPRPR